MDNSIWTIDWIKNTATHPLGHIAYFDPEPTTSGAIRCLGPFVIGKPEMKAFRELVTDLSEFLLKKSDGNYLVWGSYDLEAKYLEHKFPIIGQNCGYTPSISLGGRLFPERWKKEWKFDGARATHHSGIVIGGTPEYLDKALFHPDTFQAEIEISRRLLAKICGWTSLLSTIQRLPTWTLAKDSMQISDTQTNTGSTRQN